MGKLQDARILFCGDVVRLAWRSEEKDAEIRSNGIRDIEKWALRTAITCQRNILPSQRITDKVRKDAPIVKRH